MVSFLRLGVDQRSALNELEQVRKLGAASPLLSLSCLSGQLEAIGPNSGFDGQPDAPVAPVK
ncbi:MAG: hypothetical protein EOR60_28980 [Mesorhizobium sp.]|nr:MAG: hypothetical protein EOR60_28980 [Mesorhizobium sp.]